MIQIKADCNSAQEIMGLSNGSESIDVAFDHSVIDHFVLLLKVLCIKPKEIEEIERRMYELTGTTKQRPPVSFREGLKMLNR